MGGQKHISFEENLDTKDRRLSRDGRDGHSSASDDDRSAVEVVFDKSNPYRRKSSLVSAEAPLPKFQQQKPDKSSCAVHQLLQYQQKAKQGDLDGSTRQGGFKHSGYDGTEDEPREARHNGSSQGPMTLAKKKNIIDRCSVLSPGGSDSDTGQVDEKEWKQRITRPTTDLDKADESLHSRLLTKKQLSEMAWGVRELSRRLGSMRLKFRVKSIFLLTKVRDEDLIPKARELTRWLLDIDRDVRYTVYLERTLKDSKHFDAAGLSEELKQQRIDAGESKEVADKEVSKQLRWWESDMCRSRPHTFDFVITLGGDGTVLYASWLFQRIVPPVLSFALGSLGFLTKFDFDDYQRTLTGAFNDGVTVSLRLRFEGTVMRSEKRKQQRLSEHAENSDEADEIERKRDLVEELIGDEKDDEHTHRPDGTYEILNEIVVDRGPNPTMSHTEIFGDDEHFTTIMADGICVSTPTGSTAYNLAAGGSLCHPENPVMLVTAICAHTLSFRPIILPDTIVLRIGVPYEARNSSWASFDGRERVELKPGDYVTISASRYPFASVQAQGRRSEDWVNSISGKLGWNTRQKQKAWKDYDDEPN